VVKGSRGQTRAGHLFCLQAHVTRELPSLVSEDVGEMYDGGGGRAET